MDKLSTGLGPGRDSASIESDCSVTYALAGRGRVFYHGDLVAARVEEVPEPDRFFFDNCDVTILNGSVPVVRGHDEVTCALSDQRRLAWRAGCYGGMI